MDNMVVTEASDSSAENEGEQTAGTSVEGTTIPYNRFKEVNDERKALKQQLENLSRTQAPRVPQQEGGKFKQSYANIDEFYTDVVRNAANDPAFLDALLTGLFEKNGDKFDDVLFQSLTRKNQKLTQESEEITNKMVEENDKKLDEIEANFGVDTAGFQAFKDWVSELVVDKDPKDVPNWAKDLDSLYGVYKQYVYKTPEVPQGARKIARTKVGGKVSSAFDDSGDFSDILRRSAQRGAIAK
jgi:hypothetical protein